MCCAFSWAFVCQEVKRPLCFFIYSDEGGALKTEGGEAEAMTKPNRTQTEKI